MWNLNWNHTWLGCFAEFSWIIYLHPSPRIVSENCSLSLSNAFAYDAALEIGACLNSPPSRWHPADVVAVVWGPQVAFTGSVETGRRVNVAAATNLRPTSMELGGKSAMLVFDDVDIDKVVRKGVDD